MTNPILILLPSLNRPNQLSDCIASLVKTGKGLADILVIGGDGGVINAFNSVPYGLLSRYHIIGMFGDDVRMKTPGWDTLVLSKLYLKTGLVYGRDGHQDRKLCTHPFMTVNIIGVLGFIYPPQLHHFCGDNFLMELLSPFGKVEYVENLFTDHLHPDTLHRVPLDDTYRNERQWWDVDLETWKVYRANYLPDDRRKIASL